MVLILLLFDSSVVLGMWQCVGGLCSYIVVVCNCFVFFGDVDFVVEYCIGVYVVDVFFLCGDDYCGDVVVDQVVQCMGNVDELVDGKYQYQVDCWNGWND